MRVAILYTPAEKDAPPQDLDGLVQLESVSDGLRKLGHEVFSIPCELNLESVRERLLQNNPDLVFNLVESVAGKDRLLHFAPALLEAMALPFTGSGLMAMLLTTNKLEAKRAMHLDGLPTPGWLERNRVSPNYPKIGERVIVKSAWDHGSAGLDDDAVFVLEDFEETTFRLNELSAVPGDVWFCEQYIEGREFNLSVLSGRSGPRVLPAAEIIFEGFASDRPRVVGYRAKWDTTSFEYAHTPRTFEFDPRDEPLIKRLEQLSRECWRLFGLRGFARVDFRVDESGEPWILEVNVNPCLSPDAGFAAALERAGITYSQGIAQIIADI